MKFLKIQSPTWDAVWARLVLAFGDAECQCKETGEVWQYMGTVIKKENGREQAEHQFRHRSLPSDNGKRAYWSTLTDIAPNDYNDSPRN